LIHAPGKTPKEALPQLLLQFPVKNESIGRLAFEMGFHRWFILSKHAEIKNTRTNLKKLGCLFESFLGAMFLDFNHIEHSSQPSASASPTLSSVVPSALKVAPSVLSSVASLTLGLGFQYVQIFIERVFEKHVNWMELIQNDDNYKNILQVRIQKEFKVTPHYMEIEEHSLEAGYYMGVYLCLGQPVFGLTHQHSVPYDVSSGFDGIHQYMSMHGKIFIFLGSGKHKIKKKAEQIACEEAIRKLPL
jgi:dsRNA-specific ribonuclease